MDNLCFSPPDSLTPFSPINVSYLFGRLLIKSCASPAAKVVSPFSSKSHVVNNRRLGSLISRKSPDRLKLRVCLSNWIWSFINALNAPSGSFLTLNASVISNVLAQRRCDYIDYLLINFPSSVDILIPVIFSEEKNFMITLHCYMVLKGWLFLSLPR